MVKYAHVIEVLKNVDRFPAKYRTEVFEKLEFSVKRLETAIQFENFFFLYIVQ